MTDYEMYIFLLCLIVFLALTALSVACIWIIARLSLRLIRGGLEDEKILEEAQRNKDKQPNKYAKILDYAISGAVCLIFLVAFLGSLAIRCTEGGRCGLLPTYRVVRTDSMATCNRKNEYLFDNDLKDQIQPFDLIRTEKLPEEMELELYDIVVYEVD